MFSHFWFREIRRPCTVPISALGQGFAPRASGSSYDRCPGDIGGAGGAQYFLTKFIMTEATHPNRATAEARLIACFKRQPESSLAWEAYQHAQFSWNSSVLSWVEAMVASSCLADLYGFSGELIDLDEFTHETGSHLNEILHIWCTFHDDPEAPAPNCSNLVAQLYWFALKYVTLEVARQADVSI